MPGGLTVWNRQADASVEITAEITDVSAGSTESPVRGSGVFVGGHGTDDGKAAGGRLRVTTLSTGQIHTDGGMPRVPRISSAVVCSSSAARSSRT